MAVPGVEEQSVAAAPGVKEQPVPASAVRARARARAARNRTASGKPAPRRDTTMIGIAVDMLASLTPAR